MQPPFRATHRPAASVLHRRPAAFTADSGRPICPHCWSQLDLDWGKGRGAGERQMRGWRVGRAAALESEPGAGTALIVVHRCANRDCPTAVEVTMRLGGGYVPANVEAHRLVGADAERFAAGRCGRDGVWRGPSGVPRTTPEQRDLFGA
jgi:hypothetical protein